MNLGRTLCIIGVAAAQTLFGPIATAADPAATGAQNQNVAGAYWLRGVSEVAAVIRVAPDSRYSLDMTYGGTDIHTLGRWSLHGDVLTLVADPPATPAFALGARSDTVPSTADVEADKPTVLIVKVVTPELGMTWSNIEVSGEFSNGQTRSGLTGRNGQLGFLDRADEAAWRGATVRRVGVAYPKGNVEQVWFEVGRAETRYLTIHFEPGWLIHPKYEPLVLQVHRDATGRRSLVVQRSPDESDAVVQVYQEE